MDYLNRPAQRVMGHQQFMNMMNEYGGNAVVGPPVPLVGGDPVAAAIRARAPPAIAGWRPPIGPGAPAPYRPMRRLIGLADRQGGILRALVAEKKDDKVQFADVAQLDDAGHVVTVEFHPDAQKGADKSGYFLSGINLTIGDSFDVKVDPESDPSAVVVIGIGLYELRMDAPRGDNFIGYRSTDGMICVRGKLLVRGSPYKPGDAIGCGLRSRDHDRPEVYFSVNGIQEPSAKAVCPPLQFHPVISVKCTESPVKLQITLKGAAARANRFIPIPMAVDGLDEDWKRLHNVTLNGSHVEYAGAGRSIKDVGFAQAKESLNTQHHYFEIKIENPGAHCYIAIGITWGRYPSDRHPGWNPGSVAYHADDGKLFVGSGVGEEFGPQCYHGDTMGCGIAFPVTEEDYLPSDDLAVDFKYSDSEEESDCGEDEDAFGDNPTGDDVQENGKDDESSLIKGKKEGDDESKSSSSHDEDSVDKCVSKLREAELLLMEQQSKLSSSSEEEEEEVPNVADAEDDFDNMLRNRQARVHRLRDRIRRRRRPRMYDDMLDLEPGEAVPPKGDKIMVYFTKNGETVGKVEAEMPKDQYFPTVGMLKPEEKVSINLQPLTG